MARPVQNETQRFWSKVAKDSEESCWLWSGTLARGYGQFRVGGAKGYRINAHKYSYITTRGPIPDGLVLDHLCRVKNCVNPRHLEAVTQRVNLLRGVGPTAKNAAKTHCPRGHELTGDNILRHSKKGGRQCRMCHRDDARKRSRNNRG